MQFSAADGVGVVLLTTAPAPPERFDNLWTLQIVDADDSPMTPTDVAVVPFMPDHGHGTPQPPKPVAGSEPGSYSMGPFDLWMPGIWEMTFTIEHEATTSTAVLTLCIEE